MTTATTAPVPHATETINGRWRLDPQRSGLEFAVKHFWGLLTIRGHFEDYEGQLDLRAKPAIELTIDAASLQTGNRIRDRHLRSADFFDAENHSRVRFTSDSVEQQGGVVKVTGRLSAAGRSIPIEVSAEVRQLDDELEIEAVAPAFHRELGMTYSPLGMISSRSELSVRGHLIR